VTPARAAASHVALVPPRDLKIVLSHPHGNANSYHAARAFAEAGWLERFQTGIAKPEAASRLLRFLPADVRQRSLNRRYVGIPEARKQSHLLWEGMARLGRKLRPGGLTAAVNWYDVLFCGHDFQAARGLAGAADAVYAYEDGARRTFAAARRSRIATLYELPLGYYRGVADEINRARQHRPDLQDGVYAEPHWKQARKDEELRLAETVIVPCAWALDSLRFSRAGDKTVIKIPYGTPADEIAARQAPPAGPFTVLFAGHIGLRKGVPHLIEAWEKLQLKDARLWLAGSLNLPAPYLREHAASFEYLGALPQVELLERMRQADLLVFPSLAEGFGLVIGEAMACGVPVLTTTNTGGPELIEDGRQGWCVPAHAVAPLAERLEWAHAERQALFEMGAAARRKAEQWTWGDYRRRLIEELAAHL
jgi:alpha-maltose-1-phosphate synthase